MTDEFDAGTPKEHKTVVEDATGYLNGVEIAYNLYGGNSYGYGFQGQCTFDVTTGFTSGLNTLQFVVENGMPNSGEEALLRPRC